MDVLTLRSCGRDTLHSTRLPVPSRHTALLLLLVVVHACCSLGEAGSPRSCVPPSSSVSSITGDLHDACPVVGLGVLLRGLMHAESYVGPMQCQVVCSTLFNVANDVADAERLVRARQRGPPAETVADRVPLLWGSSDTLSYFELRAEMEALARARRVLGMNPEEYEFVLQQLHIFTNETYRFASDDNDALVEEDPQRGSGDAGADGRGVAHTDRPLFPPLELAAEEGDDGCASRPSDDLRCHWAKAVRTYRRRANKTLTDTPWLLVDRATLARAKEHYVAHVLRGGVVRVLHLDAATAEADGDSVENALRFVQQMWHDAVLRAEQDPSIEPPLLPFIDLEELIGPALPYPPRAAGPAASTSHKTANGEGGRRRQGWPGGAEEEPGRMTSISLPVRRPFRHRPYEAVVPTAVVYHFSADDESCPLCALYGASFDLLPYVFRGICASGHRSLVSCSPVTLFVSVKEQRAFHAVPRFSLFARTSPRGLFDPAEILPRLSRLVSGEWQFELSSPEYDVPAHDLPTVPAAIPHLYIASSFEGLTQRLRPVDDFQAQSVALHRLEANPMLHDVVVELVRALMYHGSIQARSLSMEEVFEITRSNERLRRRARQTAEAALGNQTDNATGTLAKPLRAGHNTAQKITEDLIGKLEIVTVGENARRLVEGYLAALYGRHAKERYDFQAALWETHQAEQRRRRRFSALGFAWSSLSIADKTLLLASVAAAVWQFDWNRRRGTRLW